VASDCLIPVPAAACASGTTLLLPKATTPGRMALALDELKREKKN